MKRQIVLDTETTGLLPEEGHRIIEIGAIELIDGCRTGHQYQCYFNPERDIDPGAQDVHGISVEFLCDKPRFAEKCHDFMTWIFDAELIIHNAPFDIGFLDQELELAGWPTPIDQMCNITDTLTIARDRWPGEKHSLDAMCKLLGVDTSRRSHHGALLDADLLAQCYQRMTT